ncbi:MAG: acyltransferase, partial [Rhodobacteraceae bacterium]|nr:acyltransferase [Paracoccaceae bacterium]
MPAPDTGYRREIDGLRAVAVLPVMAFHAGFPGFTGGFIGVDVFFVISGYLITGILLGDLQEGRYSIARFYERRARRILPALFVVIAASCAAGYALLLPPAFEDFSASVFAVLLFLSNMLFISEVDYFAPAAEETPLLHTWSLAVEEQ